MSATALWILLAYTGAAPVQAAAPDVVISRPQQLVHENGTFVRYVPTSPPRGLLVLVHGSIDENGSAIEAAELYIGRWTALAEQRGLIVLAPAFDQANFGGFAGPGGGYRGLFGRHVGADEFVNGVVDATRAAFAGLPEKFYLYGHSAGGQFVSRYVVRHPQRVEAAVICAAGTFAFPDPDVPWTNGMQTLTRRMRWSDDEPWKQIEIKPDPAGWLAAAQIPIAVVVGQGDDGEIKELPGNPGRTHIERGRKWVQAMQALARENGKAPGVRFVAVERIGHDSEGLTPACQKALFRAVRGAEGS